MKDSVIKNKIRSVLSAIHYYQIKASVKQRLYLRKLVREDNNEKRKVNYSIQNLRENVSFGGCDLIVSLTSYGNRITDSLPYTLYSLIKQVLLPKGIEVYIGKNEYDNADELPELLQRFLNIGVNFHFVDDLRSYKKLIFALQDFPGEPIITVDDDMIYHPSFISSFWAAYLDSDKKTVLGSIGRYEQKDNNGYYLPYSQWIDCRSQTPENACISFYGCGGCLYPPHIFDNEIFNVSIFQKLAPLADDLWFWAMEKRQMTNRHLVSSSVQLYKPVNRIEMFRQKGTLTYQNDILKKNDLQLESLISYYKLNAVQ